jgi:hypothetical protein
VALLVLPPRVVNPRFYRIQLLIVLGLSVGAGMLGWETAPDLFWLALGIGVGGCLVGYSSWSADGLAAGSLILIGVAAALSIALISTRTNSFAPTASGWLAVMVESTAVLVLGLATTAMLMGHWYLIAPTMSLEPLMRLLVGLFLALGLRVLTALAELLYWAGAVSDFDRLTWLWLAVRYGVGFVGPLVLGWMAWQAACIRSTQSATGILYVVVIFCYMGELTDQLLHGHLGAPARGF